MSISCYTQLPRMIRGNKMLESLKIEVEKFGEKYVVEKINSVLDDFVLPAIIKGLYVIDTNTISLERLLKITKERIYKGVDYG